MKLNDLGMKKRIFSNLQKLRDHRGQYEHISIAHDLTKKQRREFKEKLEEAKRKDQESEGNWKHLVRGFPGNLENNKSEGMHQ